MGVRSTAALLLAITIAGCSGPATPAPRRTGQPLSAAPTSAQPAGVSLGDCPALTDAAALPVIARTGGAPDDLAATADDGLWVSDETHGTITRLDARGRTVTVLKDPRGPEGVIPLGQGRLVVAEQRADRVVVLGPASAAPIGVIAHLNPVPGVEGLDSIALDATGRSLLVPDSARGALRTVSVAGGATTTLATGLGRPVSATMAPDGSIVVASESGPGLWRVAPGAAPARLGNLTGLDDVVARSGLLYVTDLRDGTLRAVDPSTGSNEILVTGIVSAQGLAILASGRLAVSDAGRGVVLAASPC